MSEQKTYSNEMRFSLFKNDKDGNEKRPDYRGSAEIGGVEYKLSAWIRTSRDGMKFMSGSIEPKQERAAQPATKPVATETNSQEQVDDVPF